MGTDICATALGCIYDFQTLISGGLAILAAAATAYFVWKSAYLPILEQKRRETEIASRRSHYACVLLSANLQQLLARARQADGTVRAVVAANASVNDNTRTKTRLELHSIVGDWEFMSLLPRDIVWNIMRMQSKVAAHNFDMERAGGAFGADEFRRSILARINSIQIQANQIVGQIMAFDRAIEPVLAI